MDLIALEEEGMKMFQAQAHIWNHMFSYVRSMSLRCVVQLGIPEIVNNNHNQPITLSELVTKLAIPHQKTDHLYRLMRLMVYSGFFALRKVHEDEQEEGYVLTPYSKFLLKDNPTSMLPFFLVELDQVLMKPFNLMSEWFKGNDVTPFETTYKCSMWNYANENPNFNVAFNEAMASDSIIVTRLLVTKCKVVFQGLGSLVDVGGGTGTTTKAIAETFPDLKCIVFDLPHVVADLEGNTKNLDYVGGDMFDSIPKAQAVLLKWIIHDWNDEECVQILKRCREAINSRDEGGKVIIIDIVVDDKQQQGENKSIETQLFSDMVMMAHVGGRERTEKEWEELFIQSGFSHYKIAHVLGLRSLIEVYP
ncbi:trans-resveratrol di-O-methyltransferase-like [Telopea speciosissima]|uniref:trans-resveratrol di-O-methyltransferase-like n=1 Tax=Telopea speciosissima TaxID=54955 RepID=UPI001CC66A58|nr:trans-resveratrol di-O-methyltransferase-like [Telopea speciosissima]